MAGMVFDSVRRSLGDLRLYAEHGECCYIAQPYGSPAKKLCSLYIDAFLMMLSAVGFLRPFMAFMGLFTAYVFYLYCKIWHRCGYSIALIAAVSVAALAVMYGISAIVHAAVKLLISNFLVVL
ncbi:MAG: hypothetical protein WCQ72_00775 [Eubacteriales bacterium]